MILYTSVTYTLLKPYSVVYEAANYIVADIFLQAGGVPDFIFSR